MRTAPIVCPEESPLVRPQAHTPCPGWSLTRRLRRGRWGCRPDGGSTFFRSERKYQRKHAARRLREKGFYCPFCRRGSQRRAHQSGELFPALMRAPVLAFFRRQNGRPFSLRCLSPLGSPAGGAGQTQPMRIGMFWRGLGGFAAQNSRLGFCSTVGINNHAQTTQCLNHPVGML